MLVQEVPSCTAGNERRLQRKSVSAPVCTFTATSASNEYCESSSTRKSWVKLSHPPAAPALRSDGAAALASSRRPGLTAARA